MLTAKMGNGVIGYAPEVDKSDAPFVCPGCGGAVILKKGVKKIHHFAHVPDSTCELRGESVEHMTAKWDIYQALKHYPDIARVEMEHVIPGIDARADVMFRTGAHVVAVEIQRSRLSNEIVMQRLERYGRKGINVVWLLTGLTRDAKEPNRVSPQKWQALLHKLYYGRVYLYCGGLDVLPVHFDKYLLWHEEGYDQDREFHAGYEYRSRRYRTARALRSVHLVDDFRPYSRYEPALIRIWKDRYLTPRDRL